MEKGARWRKGFRSTFTRHPCRSTWEFLLLIEPISSSFFIHKKQGARGWFTGRGKRIKNEFMLRSCCILSLYFSFPGWINFSTFNLEKSFFFENTFSVKLETIKRNFVCFFFLVSDSFLMNIHGISIFIRKKFHEILFSAVATKKRGENSLTIVSLIELEDWDW